MSEEKTDWNKLIGSLVLVSELGYPATSFGGYYTFDPEELKVQQVSNGYVKFRGGPYIRSIWKSENRIRLIAVLKGNNEPNPTSLST